MRIAQQTHLVSIQLERYEIDLDLVELGYNAAVIGRVDARSGSSPRILLAEGAAERLAEPVLAS